MKLAITVWNDRVSPVFDAAVRILLLSYMDGEEVGREEIGILEAYPPLRVQRLRKLDVDVLICGAVSNPMAALIETAGIMLIPWISGDVEEIIEAFRTGGLSSSRYSMPGCRRRGRRFRGGGCGTGRSRPMSRRMEIGELEGRRHWPGMDKDPSNRGRGKRGGNI